MRRHACARPDALLPVHEPMHCYREVCKQLILLEDHLNDPQKRCPDCIRKHFLTIEAFIEEANSLDTLGKWEKQGRLVVVIRALACRWTSGQDHQAVARVLRKLRKGLVPLCFDLSPLQTKTASTKATTASLVADVHMARRAAESGEVMIFRKDILGAVAFWGVKQSPYHCPEALDIVLGKLTEILQPRTQTLMGSPVLWFKDLREFRNFLDTSLKSLPEFEWWNVPKSERDLPEEERSAFGFTSMYWQPQPDNDFIDLDALIQNAANMVWALSTAPDDDYPLTPESPIPVKG